MVAFEQIRRDDPPMVRGYRCELRRICRRGVSGRIDRRIRYALKVVIDRDTTTAPIDAGRCECQITEVGSPSGAVHHQIRIDCVALATTREVNTEAWLCRFDSRDFG